MYLDLANSEGLKKEVFDERVIVDYKSFFGCEPFDISGGHQVDTWLAGMKKLDSWQHITT